ncbi:MAG: thiamine pyrophosphate-binding protein [Bosea sp.]|uniref:thiamine pyrophosphate-binding protein n=1 Tax=Hyphomicrobiales TaxID=356 RepID=UPI000836AB86|nr:MULTISPECIES: thiamine pyrophosphate-dependent enzyme [Hyphomicrobiales]MCP4561802.1 thiamine pyrophosphate-binding protein [Bosea sp. (in: a-proteobacteria)]MCP4738162.1 thiamine pyrophosphate-binding protein [Bosea sp. (in: a-proteobacteria)]MDX3804807.1 thiamine pyrophosphate-binding protein [Bosea sp. (in: a-proteobacteria)]
MSIPLDGIDVPVASHDNGIWGSDAVAAMLRKLDIPYLALNPGSSFRGLHDSLVNHLGNEQPQMLLCLHEEHAVAVAHGYAKVAGHPMGVILHSNVGLMHGAMAIYNAWCDRVPMLILGATGPFDAAERRPWIDWLHTAKDQAALIRPYIKWDDQPVSVPATLESLLRAVNLTRATPMAPTYVCLDVSMQERRLEAMPEFPDPARYRAPSTSVPASDDITAAAALLAGARNPLILLGRLSRDPRDWARRVALAERLKARVLTDIKVGAVFPTDHELHAAKPGHFLDETGARHIREADVIAAFDWVDLAGTLKQGGGAAGAKVINVALDHHLHNGWSMDHQALPPADLYLSGDPDLTLHLIADELGVGAGSEPDTLPALPALNLEKQARELDVVSLAAAIGEVLRDEIVSLVRLPLGWAGESWHFRHPLDYLGSDGGAGIGSGPGMLVGAALAFKGSERLPVAVLGDGDTMMGVSALWTAAHYKLPFLAIVSNNRSFYNDEIHQERVARTRDRPVENKWIGQRIGDPDIDIAAIARAQGLVGIGPVTTTADLVKAVREGVSAAKAGASVVIDARVKPGYNPTMAAGMTREGSKTAGD